MAEDVIAEALADVTEETEIETACRLLEKQYREKLSDRREREKAKAALQRRGFGYEVIRAAAAQVLEKLPQAQPEAEEPPEWEDRTEELLTLIRKRYRKNLTDRPGIEKTTAALYRRGYPLDEIRTAMKMILEQEENGCDD